MGKDSGCDFIRIGQNFVDMRKCSTLTFYKADDGYVAAQVIMSEGKALHIPIRDRCEFSHALMQMEQRMGSPDMTLGNMNKFMDDIEKGD